MIYGLQRRVAGRGIGEMGSGEGFREMDGRWETLAPMIPGPREGFGNLARD